VGVAVTAAADFTVAADSTVVADSTAVADFTVAAFAAKDFAAGHFGEEINFSSALGIEVGVTHTVTPTFYGGYPYYYSYPYYSYPH
jgi:hypothetical protein